MFLCLAFKELAMKGDTVFFFTASPKHLKCQLQPHRGKDLSADASRSDILFYGPVVFAARSI